jgi:TatD DNase family protein
MLGFHPWEVAEASPGWETRLEALLLQHRAGLGECGLDFARRPFDRETQLRIFRLHLRLAARLHRPVAIHCVRAWDTLKALFAEEGLPRAGAMIHAFSGSAEMARELQKLGLLLSFSSRLADPAAARLRSALAAVQDDHLLLESDAPGPAAREPGVLSGLLEQAAAVRGCSIAHMAGITHRNGERFCREAMA